MTIPESSDRSQLEGLFHRAIACRSCFEDLGVSPARVALAQPRWVGPKYWSARIRVVIVMLNPGGGTSYSSLTNQRLTAVLDGFGKGQVAMREVFEQQELDMPNWGRKGQFLPFYTKGLGLELESIAFGNIAWCATQGDKYPGPMLDRCFERHTSVLLQTLAPNTVLLSGSSAHRFQGRIQALLPGCSVVTMRHYAHRDGAAAEAQELERVRWLLHGQS